MINAGDLVNSRFDAGAAAPWGCGGLWWSVKHCGVDCPVSRLIHLKLDETVDISHSFGTEGIALSRGLVQSYVPD